MAAPTGNNFWTLRETHGREKDYPTVKDLAEGIMSYVEWAQANPWFKIEQLKKPVLLGINKETGQKEYQTIAHIPTARPMSITALCDHLEIHHKTWKTYGKREDFSAIVSRTEQFIATQQWEGATVGVFQHYIIARTLGMVEKTETGYRDKDGNPIDPPKAIVITSIFPDTKKDI
jgi:hypothetical protein